MGRRGDKCHGSSDPDIQERHSRLSRHPHGDQKRERRRDEEQGRPSSRSHHDKESKMKSAVVVKRSSGGQDSDDISEESKNHWSNYKMCDYFYAVRCCRYFKL